MATTVDAERVCRRCGEAKSVDQFYRKRNSYESNCRACVQLIRKERRANREVPTCTVEGCMQPQHSRSKCNTHYRQELKLERPVEEPKNPCACGCGEFTKSTFKTGHHLKMPDAVPPVSAKPVDERIKNSVDITVSGCWEWTLAIDKDGYGSIKVGGKSMRASRVSYEVFVDDIPVGFVVSATCRNRACVNPAHLDAISMQECVIRGESDPLKNFAEYHQRRRAATHCPHGHEWSPENTRYADDGGRVCRSCLREAMQSRRTNPSFVAVERERERESYSLNREVIRERKSVQSRAKYAEAKKAGRCVYGSGRRCDQTAAPGRSQCAYHLELSAARTWGIRKHPLEEIYALRGIEVCWVCGTNFDDENRMNNDHLIPRSLGGPDEPWNLAPICHECNSRRSNLPLNLTIPHAEYPAEATQDFPEQYRSYLT